MALKNVNVTDQTYSSDGREFHSLGAATWNALSLRVTLVLKEGASSKTAQEERKLYAPCDLIIIIIITLFNEGRHWLLVTQ